MGVCTHTARFWRYFLLSLLGFLQGGIYRWTLRLEQICSWVEFHSWGFGIIRETESRLVNVVKQNTTETKAKNFGDSWNILEVFGFNTCVINLLAPLAAEVGDRGAQRPQMQIGASWWIGWALWFIKGTSKRIENERVNIIVTFHHLSPFKFSSHFFITFCHRLSAVLNQLT